MASLTTTSAVALLGLALALPSRAASPAPPDEGGPILDIEGSEDDGDDGEPAAPTNLLDNLTEKVGRLVDRTVLGGYGELEYYNEKGADSHFVHHRYVLFVHSAISERISTTAELELEFGGSPVKRDGILGHGEALLEFMVADFEIMPWLVLRGGIILVPFGAFNLRHDSPTRDLTERPGPLTTITPTTWFEAGAGFFGDVELGDTATLDYEVYAINGLDAKITREHGMKGAVGSKGEDNNDDKAIVGRVAFSPFIGLEVGVSGYTGEYDDRAHRVNMVGGDLTLRMGRFELLGEYVRAFIDEGYVEGFSASSEANTREAVPAGMQGFYVQANVHFPIPGLWDLLPPDLADATMTGVIRYEDTDTDLDVVDEHDMQKLTFGLNFRPVESYVIKSELQLVTRATGGRSRHLFSGAFDPTPRFVASIAFLF